MSNQFIIKQNLKANIYLNFTVVIFNNQRNIKLSKYHKNGHTYQAHIFKENSADINFSNTKNLNNTVLWIYKICKDRKNGPIFSSADNRETFIIKRITENKTTLFFIRNARYSLNDVFIGWRRSM